MVLTSSEKEEIEVIDDDLILSALTDDKEEVSSKTRLAQMVLEASKLELSYKKIGCIANLQGFQSLVKLCLDNNKIEKIENLDELIHLEWLDLSFNKIQKIENVSKLTKLSDLSLFNNEITDLAPGLDDCSKLQCLSLGNNKITALDSIIKLRKFKELQLLNLEGNPVSKECEYRAYVLAYLSQLTYLDYSMVLKSEIVAAREQYQDELLDVEEKESLDQEKEAREKLVAENSRRLSEANLDFVEFLFDEMFKGDLEFLKFKSLPGISEVYQSFKSEVETASDAFLITGKAKDEQKQEAVQRFEMNLQALRQKYTTNAIERIEAFLRTKKRFLRDLLRKHMAQDGHFVEDEEDADPEQPPLDLDLLTRNPSQFLIDMPTDIHLEAADLQPIDDKLQDLYTTLMEDEMKQVENFEVLMNAFENDYAQLKSNALEAQQTYFRAVEDHEAAYAKEVTQLITDILDKMNTTNDDDILLAGEAATSTADISAEASDLLADRDTCLAAVTGSHDSHVSKLFKVEDQAKNTEDTRCRDRIKSYRDFEHNRNRSRVLELVNFKNSVQTELRDIATAATYQVNDEMDAD